MNSHTTIAVYFFLYPSCGCGQNNLVHSCLAIAAIQWFYARITDAYPRCRNCSLYQSCVLHFFESLLYMFIFHLYFSHYPFVFGFKDRSFGVIKNVWASSKDSGDDSILITFISSCFIFTTVCRWL